MPHVLVVVWIAYTGFVGYEPRMWEEVVMQEFSTLEKCESAVDRVRKSAPRAGAYCVPK